MTLAMALKVHLRVIELHRTLLRVVTLRPQTRVRFTPSPNTAHTRPGATTASSR